MVEYVRKVYFLIKRLIKNHPEFVLLLLFIPKYIMSNFAEATNSLSKRQIPTVPATKNSRKWRFADAEAPPCSTKRKSNKFVTSLGSTPSSHNSQRYFRQTPKSHPQLKRPPKKERKKESTAPNKTKKQLNTKHWKKDRKESNRDFIFKPPNFNLQKKEKPSKTSRQNMYCTAPWARWLRSPI